MMDNNVFFAELVSFLEQFSPIPANLTPDQDLFEHNLLQSLALVSLVVHLEQKYQVSLNERDLHEDNFRTLLTIANLIESKNHDMSPGNQPS